LEKFINEAALSLGIIAKRLVRENFSGYFFTSLLYIVVKINYNVLNTTMLYKLPLERGLFMKNSQLLKGVLEGCVLEVINQKEIYGYDLIRELQDKGFAEIKGGTIYPLLQKLEKNKLINGKNKPSSDGPNRKYFTITKEGKAELETFKKQWNNLINNVRQVFKGDV